MFVNSACQCVLSWEIHGLQREGNSVFSFHGIQSLAFVCLGVGFLLVLEDLHRVDKGFPYLEWISLVMIALIFVDFLIGNARSWFQSMC